MIVKKLQHYNIRTLRYDDTVHFYQEVLDMRLGAPPGAPAEMKPTWLHDETGEAVLHLIPVDPADPTGSYSRVISFRGAPSEASPVSFTGSGSIDHVAFACDGWAAMMERLRTHDVSYTENHLPRFGLHQLFIVDPNGVTLELNFQSID
jgi:catechol 2,3-dioxygenase-like lactoylglutathione lyase family enzyme